MSSALKLEFPLVVMSADEYHSLKDVLSNSQLSHFLQSPAHLQAYLKTLHEPTPSQILGTLIHTCVLEPEFLDREYKVGGPFKLNTNIGKEGLAAWQATNPGKKLIDQETYDQVDGIVRAVYSHNNASRFLENGVAERSVFWTDEKTGVKCRARIDYFREDHGILTDFKSTMDATFKSFQRDVSNFGYYRQLAFYARGLKANGFAVNQHMIIAAEKSAPYGVKVYEMDPTAIVMADHEIDAGLAQYSECVKSGLWPAYEEEIEVMTLPAWHS